MLHPPAPPQTPFCPGILIPFHLALGALDMLANSSAGTGNLSCLDYERHMTLVWPSFCKGGRGEWDLALTVQCTFMLLRLSTSLLQTDWESVSNSISDYYHLKQQPGSGRAWNGLTHWNFMPLSVLSVELPPCLAFARASAFC